MKRSFYKRGYLLLMLASAFAWTACEEDVESLQTTDYDTNFVYVNAKEAWDHKLSYLSDGSFHKGMETLETLIPIQCTHAAQSDINVEVAFDESLVEAYNKEHETNYVFLKSARMEHSSYKIPKGKYTSSDTLKVEYTDMSEFQNGSEKYILPVVLRSSTGGDAKISEDYRVMYLVYTSKEVLIERATDPVGKSISSSGFTYTMDGKSFTSISFKVLNSTMEVDLGQVYNVNTFDIKFYSPNYSPKTLTVWCSEDGKDFTELGTVDCKTSSPANNYIHLFAPRKIQYIRFKGEGYLSSSYRYLSSFTVYEAE